ncbi:hypothetical protein [Lutibaculum baratangense]|uniref:Uncharacterized protein n=1 Tax=Lutibaculum baratangense AMV1 TaxID=631454 RepID=V4RNT0_9HYPH|nr:hypothetical protein [Lutibaculum baratangense]ESR26894.1 hypothetical protein N177_0678 [Lutibaculum baratangense AMV1]
MERSSKKPAALGRALRVLALTLVLSTLPPLQLLPQADAGEPGPARLWTIDYANAAALQRLDVVSLRAAVPAVTDPASQKIHLGLVLILLAVSGAGTLKLWHGAVRGIGR